jgi:hypothetical protein
VPLNVEYIDFEVLGNYLEALYWAALGVLLAIFGRKPPFKPLALVGSALLIVFGASDAVEAQTGAWWRPWWLLLWKVLCLIALVWCYWHYRRIKGRLKLTSSLGSTRSVPAPSPPGT